MDEEEEGYFTPPSAGKEIRETPVVISKTDAVLKIMLAALLLPLVFLMFFWHWLVLLDLFAVKGYWFSAVAFVVFLISAGMSAISYLDAEFYLFRWREPKESFLFRFSNDRQFTITLSVLVAFFTLFDALGWLIWYFTGSPSDSEEELLTSTDYASHVYMGINVFSTCGYLVLVVAFVLRYTLNSVFRALFFRDVALADAASKDMTSVLGRIYKN